MLSFMRRNSTYWTVISWRVGIVLDLHYLIHQEATTLNGMEPVLTYSVRWKRLYSLSISCCSILYVTFPGSTHSGWAHTRVASVIDYGLNILCPCMHCVFAKAYTSLTRTGCHSSKQCLANTSSLKLSVLSMKDLCSIHRNMTVWFGIPIVNLQNWQCTPFLSSACIAP